MNEPLNRQEAQVMALAGAVQAVQLALGIARQGQAETGARASSLASVLRLSAETPEEIFAGLNGVRHGLRLLVSQLQNSQRDAELIRIGATVLSLEKKYSRNAGLQDDLRKRLESIAADFSPDQAAEAPAIDALANAYLATISTLTPRIRVTGNPLMLKEEDNVRQIRALLLAALRSVVLWRQLGGRGWQLLVQRNRLAETAQRLLGRSLALA